MKKIMFLSSLVFIISCSESKKLQKSEQRVMLNEASFNKVGKAWEKLNPCANDSNTVRVDTISEPQFIDIACDTFGRPSFYYFNPIGEGKWVSADGGFVVYSDSMVFTGKGKAKCPPQTIITKEKIVVDHRREELLENELSVTAGMLEECHNNVEQLNAQAIADRKAANRQLWNNRLWLGIPLLLIILAFIFKRRIPILKNI